MADELSVKVKVNIGTTQAEFQSQLNTLAANAKIKVQADLSSVQQQIKNSNIGSSVSKNISNSLSNTLEKELQKYQGRINTLSKRTENNALYGPIQPQIKTAQSSLSDAQTALKNGSFEQANEALKKLKSNIDSVNQSWRELNATMANKRSVIDNATHLNNLNSQIQDYIKNNQNIAKNSSLYQDLLKISEQCQNTNSNAKMLENRFSEIRTQAKALGLETDSLGQKIRTLFTKHLQTAIAVAGVHALQQAFYGMIQAVKDIDLAMTELYKVTDESASTYSRFFTDATERAEKYGATVSDVINSTADFARLGYSLPDASNLADSAIIYKNVGDGINDIGTASESIISTMKAFNVEADNSIEVVDKYNAVGNKFAISSAGIGDAMQRSASSLATANNTLDQSIALITAANSVVQNPEVVGTAMKTLSMRIRGAKTELEDAGEATEGMANTTAELRKELYALSHQKVDIMLDEDTFKSTYDIIKEMSAAWEEMTDKEQAAALELMAGKRQGNVLASLIENFDVAESVVTTSANSMGSAMAENEKRLNSIAGKTDRLNASFQTLATTLIDSGLIKGVLDFGSGLLNTFDNITKTIDVLPTLITLLSGVMSATKNVGWLKKQSYINMPNHFLRIAA